MFYWQIYCPTYTVLMRLTVYVNVLANHECLGYYTYCKQSYVELQRSNSLDNLFAMYQSRTYQNSN